MKRAPSGGDLDDLAVLDELHAAGLGQEGRDRGGDEALALAQAHHQRALLAGAHEHARVVGRHRDERVVAAQLVVGLAHGLGEVAVSRCCAIRCATTSASVSEVNSAPSAASRSRSSVQFSTIPLSTMCTRLDGVPVRVGVRLGHAAVGGPARVADAGRSRAGAPLPSAATASRSCCEVAHRVDAADRAVRDQRQPAES